MAVMLKYKGQITHLRPMKPPNLFVEKGKQTPNYLSPVNKMKRLPYPKNYKEGSMTLTSASCITLQPWNR
jgi:hypothetical protein